MKIMIIGTPRSGTTALLNVLGEQLKYATYNEPWNEFLDRTRLPYINLFEDNFVVKNIITSIPPEFDNVGIFGFYSQVQKDFDKVIILGRKDRDSLLESLTYQLEQEKKMNGRSKSLWQEPYTLTKTHQLPIEQYRKQVDKISDLLVEVSEYLNTPIYWYEDIFTEDINKIKNFLNSTGLEVDTYKFAEQVHPRNRLRKTSRSII